MLFHTGFNPPCCLPSFVKTFELHDCELLAELVLGRDGVTRGTSVSQARGSPYTAFQPSQAHIARALVHIRGRALLYYPMGWSVLLGNTFTK